MGEAVSGAGVPRYRADLPFPDYAYVPGRHPHPQRDPRGHSHERPDPAPPPAHPPDPSDWRGCAAFLYGVDLFNHGYYWEAHEAWEGLWRLYPAEDRGGLMVHGLIKLAACGVKQCEGRRRGVLRHATKAAAAFSGLPASARIFGLEPGALADAAKRLADQPEQRVNAAVGPLEPRAFSGEMDTGSPLENAQKQEARAPFRFNRNEMRSRAR